MSSTLPATAYIKMIDVWMIFTMLYPFAEIVLVWTKDFFKKRAVSKQGMCILKSRLLVGSHISNNVSLSVFFGAKLVEQCVREREKAKGGSGKIDAARKAFANMETFCKSKRCKSLRSNHQRNSFAQELMHPLSFFFLCKFGLLIFYECKKSKHSEKPEWIKFIIRSATETIAMQCSFCKKPEPFASEVDIFAVTCWPPSLKPTLSDVYHHNIAKQGFIVPPR